MSAIHNEQRSVGELFSELSQETRLLVKQEIELARAELNQKVAILTKDAVSMAVGGFVAWFGAITLVAALVIGLGHLIGYGWSALAVGVVLTAIGAFMVIGARNDLRERNLALEKTTKTLKETTVWAKEQIRR